MLWVGQKTDYDGRSKNAPPAVEVPQSTWGAAIFSIMKRHVKKII